MLTVKCAKFIKKIPMLNKYVIGVKTFGKEMFKPLFSTY